MLRIEMLPAAQGDALFLEWGSPTQSYRGLIDGGPYYSYGAVRERMFRLPEDDRHLDLLVITHIDADHIEGALRLLLDEKLNVTYGDIWFNDWNHLANDPNDMLGARHGEFVGALLDELDLPWNEAFGRGPAALQIDGEPRFLPVLPGGLEVTLLSPGPSQLKALRKKWKKVLAREMFAVGDRAYALDQLRRRARYAPPEDWLGSRRDSSVANGSSLALLIEHDGHRALLAGDAFPEVLESSLSKLGSKVAVGAFKLSHHGSSSNTSRRLLERLQVGCYLISTSGAHHNHPDPETLDLILATSSEKPRVLFNYRGKNVGAWERAAEEGRIEVEFSTRAVVEL